MTLALQVQGLVRRYGDTPVFADVDLVLAPASSLRCWANRAWARARC
jgi:hypothetical protein